MIGHVAVADTPFHRETALKRQPRQGSMATHLRLPAQQPDPWDEEILWLAVEAVFSGAGTCS